MKQEKGIPGGEGLFEDAEFPSDDTSLFSDHSTPIARLQGDITWRRPQEICQSPTLFPDQINQGHAKQGLLGDCWFLCACITLLKNKHLMNKVFPAGQALWGEHRYRGSFQVCLWQRGHWTEVTIDDRLPCIGSTLCFSRCRDLNAFWVALLEKAYAKLHGSYECLWAGQVSEALVALTGGLAERWSLRPGDTEEQQRAGQDGDDIRTRKRLNLDLLEPVKDSCTLSCSTHSSPGGSSELGQYHALNVTEWQDVETVSGGSVRLVRIRNPWGRHCHGGAWTENGEGWRSVDPSRALDLLSRTEEGAFWLDETEFLSQFDDVTVGYPISKEGHLQSIYTGNLLTHHQQLSGRWVRGLSAGGCRNSTSYSTNPKFWLKVCERGEVLVSLLQQRRSRSQRQHTVSPTDGSTSTKHQHFQAIALHMWKVEKKRCNLSRTLNKLPCASTHCHAYEMEVVLQAHLEAGYHLVVPSTFLQGAEGSFLIRVFSSSPIALSAMRTPGPVLPLATDGEWETSYFRGVWVVGSSAGGGRNFTTHQQNPCFPVTVADGDFKHTPGANVRITLHQTRPDTDLQPIGFHVYKVSEGASEPSVPKDEEPVASCIPHCYTQDVSLACRLPAGAYTIVPSTYQPDCPGQFTLTVARRIHRKVVRSQESLGKAIQEVSHISVMRS